MPLLVALLALTLAAMWMLSRCSRPAPSGIANTYRRPGGDTIAVAIELSPASYAFSGDTVTGFDYEMLRDIGRIHGVDFDFHPFVPLAYALDGMRDGRFDMAVATVPASASIGREFPLTQEAFVDRQVLVRRSGAVADSAGTSTPGVVSLLGDTVWVPASSPFRERLVNLGRELGDTIYVRSAPGYTPEHLVMLTALGEIRQAVVNEKVAAVMARAYPQLDYSTEVSLNQFQPWIVAPGREALRDSLNSWMTSYKASPAYARLMDKYFPTPGSNATAPARIKHKYL